MEAAGRRVRGGAGAPAPAAPAPWEGSGSMLPAMRVERTALKFFVDLQQPLGALRDVPTFDIRRIHPAEFFASTGASFTIALPDGLTFEAMYNIRILGTTAWSLGTVMLSAGYAF